MFICFKVSNSLKFRLKLPLLLNKISPIWHFSRVYLFLEGTNRFSNICLRNLSKFCLFQKSTIRNYKEILTNLKQMNGLKSSRGNLSYASGKKHIRLTVGLAIFDRELRSKRGLKNCYCSSCYFSGSVFVASIMYRIDANRQSSCYS